MPICIVRIKEYMQTKYENLRNYLKELGSVAIAYSSGVDSTFLLKVAHDVLKDNVMAVTLKSESFPEREYKESIRFCKENNIRQIIVESSELEIDGFKENPKNRCYLCKKSLFSDVIRVAKENGISNVAEGSNMDDNGDYRPGLLAIKELNILSPLRANDLYKEEIRALSKQLNLPTFDKPSFACLASRFVYGETITVDKLKMVDKAEELLLNLGFKQFRVRIHGNIARIEVLAQDIEKIVKEDIRQIIVSKFKDYGFMYISLDLQGYRTGSMNEVLKDRTIKGL